MAGLLSKALSGLEKIFEKYQKTLHYSKYYLPQRIELNFAHKWHEIKSL